MHARTHSLSLHLLLKEICCKSFIEKVCLPKIDASVEPDWTSNAAAATTTTTTAAAATTTATTAAANGHKSVSLSFIVHQILLDRRFNFVIPTTASHSLSLPLSLSHTHTHTVSCLA